MTVTSTSGIRGVYNSDLLPEDVAEYTRRFVRLVGGGELLLGRDTRSDTGSVVTTRSDTSDSLDVLAEVMRQAVAEGFLP